jgi:hypothetical protein
MNMSIVRDVDIDLKEVSAEVTPHNMTNHSIFPA